MFTAALLVLASPPVRLLVVRLEGERVEVVIMPANGGKAKVLHSHPLNFVRGYSVDDENHNESLAQSLACTVSPDRRSFAALELLSSTPGPQDGRPNGWTTRVNLFTVDLTGRLLTKSTTEVAANRELYLGFERGQAVLIDGDGVDGFRTFREGMWHSSGRSADSQSASGSRTLSPPDRAVHANLFPAIQARWVRREDLRKEFKSVGNGTAYSWIASPELIYTGFTTASYQGGNVFVSRDPSHAASVASGWGVIEGKWGSRTVRLSYKGHLEFAYPLAYPWVVGRIYPQRKNLPRFAPWPVVAMDPFWESAIWRINLVTGERVKMGNGIYAIPL